MIQKKMKKKKKKRKRKIIWNEITEGSICNFWGFFVMFFQWVLGNSRKQVMFVAAVYQVDYNFFFFVCFLPCLESLNFFTKLFIKLH